MKLPKPFYRLPVRFDAARLAAELAEMPAAAWADHPNDIPGNRSVRLISVDGTDNDEVDGTMLPTPHLARAPYMRQLLASFGVVWSRSRLLKLAPRAGVPRHADINHHWFTRVRLHVPIVTHPEVRFHCGDEHVHMAAGEAWLFDNWRLHWVENPVDAERVHLVADTSGSAPFWRFVATGDSPQATLKTLRYDPARDPQLLTERVALRPVMAPAEVDLLLGDLKAELMSEDASGRAERLARYGDLLDALRCDWRQLYQLFGEHESGKAEYVKLRDSVRAASQDLGAGLVMRTNRVPAHRVLEGRVLRALLPARPAAAETPATEQTPATAQTPAIPRASAATQTSASAQTLVGASASASAHPFERPIFIVAAPRSGSTLLFETLAVSDELCTVGGEAHWLVEGLPELRPGAPGVESNRLDAGHAAGPVAAHVREQLILHLQDSHGRPVPPASALRLLEKTPKNALRVPFFDRLFPDALFVFLWRDPRENLSSIMEAWRSGNWKTYNGLPGFDGPWSLILPPGWPAQRGRTLEDIAAFQWQVTTDILLGDLARLPSDRWHSVSYAELVARPAAVIERLCEFAGIAFRGPVQARVGAPLPLSRFTQTPPRAEKWRRNEDAVMRALPSVQLTWDRLRGLVR
jgi:hypothetical protein